MRNKKTSQNRKIPEKRYVAATFTRKDLYSAGINEKECSDEQLEELANIIREELERKTIHNALIFYAEVLNLPEI